MHKLRLAPNQALHVTSNITKTRGLGLDITKKRVRESGVLALYSVGAKSDDGKHPNHRVGGLY